MKLYHISQNINNGWDTYSDAVVCTDNEEQAKRMHPYLEMFPDIYYDEEKKKFWGRRDDGSKYEFDNGHGTWTNDWTNDLDKIKVEYLGEAKDGLKMGVICASFHAG